jgi:hypothetical protein
MIRVAILLAPLLLGGCQVYAGGGTLVSDGRTTTVRTSETEVGTETGARTRSTRTVIERQ